MLGGSSTSVRARAARPASRVAVIGPSSALGAVRLGWGGCGSQWFAVPCRKRGGLVRGPKSGPLCYGGRERRQSAARARPRK